MWCMHQMSCGGAWVQWPSFPCCVLVCNTCAYNMEFRSHLQLSQSPCGQECSSYRVSTGGASVLPAEGDVFPIFLSSLCSTISVHWLAVSICGLDGIISMSCCDWLDLTELLWNLLQLQMFSSAQSWIFFISVCSLVRQHRILSSYTGITHVICTVFRISLLISVVQILKWWQITVKISFMMLWLKCPNGWTRSKQSEMLVCILAFTWDWGFKLLMYYPLAWC